MAPEARSNDAAVTLLRAIMSADGRLSRPAERPAHRVRADAAGSRRWVFESGVKGGDIHGYGDAVFFTAVQLLTISSAITNPLTTGGKVVDVALEMWAISGVADSFASFFISGDSS
jgi:hypothetical protein